MIRRKHFSEGNHENYEVPLLVNTINKLVTRIDSLNQRLEKEKLWLCTHPCRHQHMKRTSDSVNGINIQQLAEAREPSAHNSTNHGSHETNKGLHETNKGSHETKKGALDINMIDEKLQQRPQNTKRDSHIMKSYQSLRTQQTRGVKGQEINASFVGTLSGQPQNNFTNHPAMTIKLDNDSNQPGIRVVEKNMNYSNEESSSDQFVCIDSAGLKSVKTDPKEDNRKKTIKDDFNKNTNSVQFNIEKHKDENPTRQPNLRIYEDVQAKGPIAHADIQKKNLMPSSNIGKNDDKHKSEKNFVKMERSADKNRLQLQRKHTCGTKSADVVSHTDKTLTRAKEPFMVQTHLPKEYWESVFHETLDKAEEIMKSRSIGLDTIICLDTSTSVVEYWEDILEFLRNLIHEIEISQPIEEGLMEHIALVTFGHETCALQHFTTNYKEVLAKIHLINPEGSTPLFWAVLLFRAILAGSALVPKLRDFQFAPRLLLITDGRPTYRYLTGGRDESAKYDEDTEKEDVATRLISIKMTVPCLRVYPVAVGNNCDMEFLTAIANSCGGKVMTLKDWSQVAQYGTKLALASKYFGLASLSQDFLVKVLRESSGLPQEDIELIATEVKDQLEYQNDEGTTTDEEEVEGSYQLPPVGSRVRRGPDWNRGDEDNNSPGTIISYSRGKVYAGWVIVKWDIERRYSRWRFRYRYGAEKAHDVKVQARENPRIMPHAFIMKIGCEVVRGSYRKSTDDDGVEEGTTGMVYNTNMDGKNVAKIRWQNGKKGVYRGEALNSGEIELSHRSRPYYEMMPFDPLQVVSNPNPLTSQASSGASRHQPPRQESMPGFTGQLSTRGMQTPSILEYESSDSDARGEREALTIENIAQLGLPCVDDMNSRNQILRKREERKNEKNFDVARYKSYTQTAPGAGGYHDTTKIRRIRRRNKNSDD
ncbi:hypothetical protein ACJMK2_038774 [Sinanodonta woodiana]|uniref:VWFA domain-containing protein n=1 Tax=Sinanodonta woodiana TaxID=1069815 RepID=A0ABD3WDT4_SINWO